MTAAGGHWEHHQLFDRHEDWLSPWLSGDAPGDRRGGGGERPCAPPPTRRAGLPGWRVGPPALRASGCTGAHACPLCGPAHSLLCGVLSIIRLRPSDR